MKYLLIREQTNTICPNKLIFVMKRLCCVNIELHFSIFIFLWLQTIFHFNVPQQVTISIQTLMIFMQPILKILTVPVKQTESTVTSKTKSITVPSLCFSAPFHPTKQFLFLQPKQTGSKIYLGGAETHSCCDTHATDTRLTDPSALPSLAVTATMAARTCMSLRLHKQPNTLSVLRCLQPAVRRRSACTSRALRPPTTRG